MLGAIRRETQMSSLIMNGRKLVLIDWRGFHDPECMELRHHLGSHPSIMRRLVEHPGFREICRQLFSILREDDGVSVTLLSYCRAGRHRSYGGTRILRAIIEMVVEKSPPIYDFSNPTASRHGCKGCAECGWRENNGEAMSILERACAIYKEEADSLSDLPRSAAVSKMVLHIDDRRDTSLRPAASATPPPVRGRPVRSRSPLPRRTSNANPFPLPPTPPPVPAATASKASGGAPQAQTAAAAVTSQAQTAAAAVTSPSPLTKAMPISLLHPKKDAATSATAVAKAAAEPPVKLKPRQDMRT